MLIRISSFLLLSLAILAAPVRAQNNNIAPAISQTQYIQQLFDSTLSDFHLRVNDKQNYLRGILEQHFQLSEVSKFVAGYRWRQANEKERRDFIDAFSGFMALTASRGLEKVPELAMSILGAKALSANVTEVISVISIPNTAEIPVNWIVVNRENRYAISDIVFLGISMKTILRDYIISSVAQTQNNLGLYAEMLKRLTPLTF